MKRRLLTDFVVLQVMDAMTTMAFLDMGVVEANPIIRFMISLGGSRFVALAVAKIASVTIAIYAFHTERHRLMRWVVKFYVVLIAWNLLAMGMQAVNQAVGQ